MKLYSPAVALYPHIGYTTALERIEEIGRVCYKSEGKIGVGTAAPFVQGLLKRGHESVIEHATFCFTTTREQFNGVLDTIRFLETQHGFDSFLRATDVTRPLLSGNARAWRSFFRACQKLAVPIPGCCRILVDSEEVLFGYWSAHEFDCELTEDTQFVDTRELTNHVELMTHYDITIKFTCDRGVSHEFVRHRVAAVSQESTRYCNYSGELGLVDIWTAFFAGNKDPQCALRHDVWERAAKQAEENYTEMVALGAKPDEARSVLINSTKTEVVQTMNGAGWHNFDKLRNAPGAHPQAREEANMLHGTFEEKFPWVLEPLAI